MKRGIIFTAVLILVLLGFINPVFCQDIKTIRIATPSFEGQTNEDGTGLFFEIVKNVYEPKGITMEFQIVPWERAEKMLEQDKADAMVGARKKPERITSNQPLWVEHKAAVFKKGAIDWKGIPSLNMKTAVWLRGYDEHKNDQLIGINFTKWFEVDEYEQAWGMVEKGRADFYIDIVYDIDQYIKKNKVDMNIFQVEIMWSENSYMSFSKSDKSKKLMEIYDTRIIELFKSGELEKIFNKWNTRYEADAWKE